MTFGVSPAWFLSLYGESFTVRQAADGLVPLAGLGFASWQPEVFHEDALEEWTSGKADALRTRSNDLGLTARTFVAHFLGHSFSDERALEGRRDFDLLDRLLESLESWTDISVISVLLPGFSHESPASSSHSRRWMDTLVGKLKAYAERIEATGRTLALEAMPGNIAGGSAGIAALLERDGLQRVGINYDSGHFHASGELQSMVLARLGDRITCTHLCDNDGAQNLSLAPGDGTIPWNHVVAGLTASVYDGSWDIEIRCPSDVAESAYRRGRDLLERQLLKESA